MDSRTLTQSVHEAQPEATFTISFTSEYNERTWHYALRELVPDDAVGYSVRTGLPIQVPKKPGSKIRVNLTYGRYRGMTPEEKDSISSAEDGIIWKSYGLAYDAAAHPVDVSLRYDEATDSMIAEMTIDGQAVRAVGSEQPVIFHNSFLADNCNVEFPVKKTLTGRSWLRGDAFTFTISAEKGTPLPQEQEITIERGILNDLPDRTGEFRLSYRWADLQNEDGSHAEQKEFIYTIREKIDPDAEGADVIRDEQGNITFYKLDQVTYDLHEEQVKVVLKDNQDGTMSAECYIMGENEAWTRMENESPAFTNAYQMELIGFPLSVQKKINGQPAIGSRTFDFVLLDSEKNPVLDTKGEPIVVTVDPSRTENATALEQVDVLLGENVSYGNPKTFEYVLREGVPDGAVPCDAEGNPLPEDDTSSEAWYWLDGMIYSREKIQVKVIISLNPVTYRLGATVNYDPGNGSGMPAIVNNRYDAKGGATLQITKQVDGRQFREGEVFAFELTAEDGAPFRTAAGEQSLLRGSAGEDSPALFDELLFTLEDLEGYCTARDFRYRIHEQIPDEALAFSKEGQPVETGESSALTYENASQEQRASEDIRWMHEGILYAPDQIITLHVTDQGNGILQTTCDGTWNEEAGAWEGAVVPDENHRLNLTISNEYRTTPAETELFVRKQILEQDGTVLEGWKAEDPSGNGMVRDWTEKAFRMQLSTEDPEAPMPEGTFTNEEGMRIREIELKADQQCLDFGKMTFDQVGTYSYKVKELPPE